MPLPVTDQQGQASTEPLHPGAIVPTGITPDATLSANCIQPGYESAAITSHGNIKPPKTLIPGAQPVGPVNEAEMPDDGDRHEPTAMDSSDTQTDAQNPSSADQQPGNLGATGQLGPAISFTPDAMADLIKAAAAGHVWDTPGQLQGASAAHMHELHTVLQKIASSQKLVETNPDKVESEPERVVIRVRHSSESVSTSSDSSSDSRSDSDSASETASQIDTAQKKKKKKKKKKKASVKGVKDLFNQAQDDVFVVSDGSGDEGGNVGDGSCPSWATQVTDAEPDWIVCYPNANPYVHSKVKHTEDGWYRGEDCASPSEAALAAKHPILPAADGSLALKADAVLPGTPPGRDKFGDRVLDRRVYHDKARRKGHDELDPIAPAELDNRARENREALGRDSFWVDPMQRELYFPAELDTPVNFAVETPEGKMAIPYMCYGEI